MQAMTAVLRTYGDMSFSPAATTGGSKLQPHGYSAPPQEPKNKLIKRRDAFLLRSDAGEPTSDQHSRYASPDGIYSLGR